MWGADPATAQERGAAWIRFDYDGDFAGFDGCNSVGGGWVLDADRRVVTARARASRAVACPTRDEASFARMTFDGTSLEYSLGGRAGTMRAGTRVPVTMFLVDNGTNRLVAVPPPTWPSLDVRTPRARTRVAIEALLAGKPEKGRTYSTYWGTFCGPGDGVESIRSSSTAVVVTLTGSGGATCDLSAEGYALQHQQLAWTVVENLGVDPRTPVRLVSASGLELWGEDVVADRSYLAPTTD